MGYLKAIEATGAKVLAYEEFGSYQGDWLAKIKVNQEIKFIQGSYGSCSECDAFEAEFGLTSHKCGSNRYYCPIYDGGFRHECEECQEVLSKLINFGQEYVDDAMSFEDCLKIISKNLDWDMDAHEMIDWLNANKETKK